MILFCHQQYRSLQKDLAFYPEAIKMDLPAAEAYFRCAFRSWMAVYKLMAAYSFQARAEEVYFFRKVKPLFTCELEFARLLCQAMLFCPQNEGVKSFWESEGERLPRFVRKHAPFCRYYRSECMHEDALRFTRLSVDGCSAGRGLYPDEHLRSHYDPLVACLLALERYNRYVHLQLDALDGRADG